MRVLLRSFTFLDAVSLVFMAMQLWHITTHFNELPDQLSVKIESVLMYPMFILVLVGAYGLFFQRNFGFILYYIQFPFRLYLWVFTVGFITLIPEALSLYDGKWFDGLLKVCFMAEFIRLYLTIRAQLKKQHQQTSVKA